MLCVDLFHRLCGKTSFVSTSYEANVRAKCDFKWKLHREKLKKRSVRQLTKFCEKWVWLGEKDKIKAFAKSTKLQRGKISVGDLVGLEHYLL